MEIEITNILILLIIIAFVILVFAAETNRDTTANQNYIEPSGTPVLTLNLSSDKKVYHSSEKMELKTMIETDSKIENLTVRVYGIKDIRGNYRVKGEKVVSAEPPFTSENFEFTMPSCYGCAGVSPGEYEIVMEVLQNGELIRNQSVTVKLEK